MIINLSSKEKNSSEGIDSLSDKEFEIAQLFFCGELDLEIANKLDLKMSTKYTYKNRSV